MSDIFREVDEEVRRDKAVEFWSRYQTHFIVLAAIVVAAAGGWRYYQNQKKAAAEEAGARYETALTLARDKKANEADAAFQDVIKQGPGGYALLARFRAASQFADTDKPKAVAIFDTLAKDSAVDPLLQDVAKLRAAMLRVDEADAAELKTRLEPLAGAGQPFRNTAREILALAALKAGDLEAAGRWFDAIVVDSQAPQSIRQRAEALLGLVAAGKSN